MMDTHYEIKLLRDTKDERLWLEYAHSLAPPKAAAILARAISHLPVSQKIWRAYLSLRTSHATDASRQAFEQGCTLFPDDELLWRQYWTTFPEPLVFKEALRWLAPEKVWPQFLTKFPDQLPGYLEYNSSDGSAVEAALEAIDKTQGPQIALVALKASRNASWGVWKAFLSKEWCPEEVFLRAWGIFPDEDVWIISRWSEITPELEMKRQILERGLRASNSPENFAELFDITTQFYLKNDSPRFRALLYKLLADQRKILKKLALQWKPSPRVFAEFAADDVPLLERCIGMWPQSVELWLALASWYCRRGQLTGMRTVFGAAVSTVHRPEDLWLAWSRMDPDQATQILQKGAASTRTGRIWTEILRKDPSQFHAAVEQRMLTLEAAAEYAAVEPKRWSEALQVFHGFPSASWLWMRRAEYLPQDDIKELRRSYEEALALRDSRDILVEYAKAERRTGSPVLAGRLLDRALHFKNTGDIVAERLEVSSSIDEQRQVYERWLPSLGDRDSAEIAERAALLEIATGSEARALALLEYASQFHEHTSSFWLRVTALAPELETLRPAVAFVPAK